MDHYHFLCKCAGVEPKTRHHEIDYHYKLLKGEVPPRTEARILKTQVKFDDGMRYELQATLTKTAGKEDAILTNISFKRL